MENNPCRYVSSPDRADEDHQKMTRFFADILEELRFKDEQIVHFIEVKCREVATEDSNDLNTRLSDDKLTELVVCGRTIAVCLTIRDDFNYTQVLFVSFLTSELREELKNIVDVNAE